MAKFAREVMTPDPACCSPDTPLDQVARMMVQHNCGEIPVIDRANRPVGVVTDRDIVCRSVAESENPIAHTAGSVMSAPVVTVSPETRLEDVVEVMQRHQIRRVPVVDGGGCCSGIIAQADIASTAPPQETAQFLHAVSRESARPSRT